MKRTIITAALLAVVMAPSNLRAAGIELQEQDARAQARALAVRAMLDNPATLFYNPAGLAYLDGFAISMGDTMVFPSFNFSDPNGINPKASTINSLVPPPNAYASFATNIHEGGRLGAGIGVNFPFGMTIEWGDDFAGRNLITKSELLIPEIMAAVSYSPVPALSFGAALVVSPAHVYISKFLGPQFGLVGDNGDPIEDAKVEMAGDGVGFGFNVGLQARPTDWLFLGLVYRSGMTLNLEGDAHFELPGLSDRSGFRDQPVEAGFELPHIFAGGIGFKKGLWYVEADVDYTLWSVFKEIPLTLPQDTTGQLSQKIPEFWKDAWTFRLGNHLSLGDRLTVSFGGGYDQSPATGEYLSPMLPDSDRIFTGAGAGYEFDFGLTLDMAYTFTYFIERTVNGHACTANDSECVDPNGDVNKYTEAGTLNWVGNIFPAHYESFAQLLSVTVGMKF